MKTANAINNHLKQCRTVGPKTVRVVLIDGEHAHCLNESDLDTWWHAHSAAEKAEIFEMILGDADESCRFCSCTQMRACVLPNGSTCGWLDANHTVCSAPACAEKYRAVLGALKSTPINDLYREADQAIADLRTLWQTLQEAVDASL